LDPLVIQAINLLFPLVLLLVGYTAGTFAERRHYRSIEERERALVTLPAVTFKDVPGHDTKESFLVMGNAVISIDYFKRFLAILRNIFGGRVSSYESLVDRARREAILRMKEAAKEHGADIIINMRIETSAIGASANRKKHIGSVEAIAYGTALAASGAAAEDRLA